MVNTKKGSLVLLLVLVGTFSFAQTSASSMSHTDTVTLSTAQLQALREDPVILVAAPGEGSYIKAASATLQYNYGTTNFPGGQGRLQITLGPYARTSPMCVFDGILKAGFLDQDADQTVLLQANDYEPSWNVDNQDLEIINFGLALIEGDGTLTVTVTYDVVARQ
jgi:hypothetical protein